METMMKTQYPIYDLRSSILIILEAGVKTYHWGKCRYMELGALPRAHSIYIPYDAFEALL